MLNMNDVLKWLCSHIYCDTTFFSKLCMLQVKWSNSQTGNISNIYWRYL